MEPSSFPIYPLNLLYIPLKPTLYTASTMEPSSFPIYPLNLVYIPLIPTLYTASTMEPSTCPLQRAEATTWPLIPSLYTLNTYFIYSVNYGAIYMSSSESGGDNVTIPAVFVTRAAGLFLFFIENKNIIMIFFSRDKSCGSQSLS